MAAVRKLANTPQMGEVSHSERKFRQEDAQLCWTTVIPIPLPDDHK